MNLDKSLYQKSHLFFAGFFALMVWGFWFTYFTRLFDQASYRMHLHGIALIVWCALLIVQPYLIRKKRFDIHRKIGLFSYFWVPFLVFSTVDLLKFKLKNRLPSTDSSEFFIALVLNALVAFLILYGLAVYNRRKGTIHARFMVSTVFPMVTPITDRIIHIFFPSWVKLAPVVAGSHAVPLFGFILADILLLGLCIWDWKSHNRRDIFPFALIVVVAYQVSVFTLFQFDFWSVFSTWFIRF